VNNDAEPLYRIDTLGNVYRFPLRFTRTSNWLIFKQHAQAHESWLMSDTTKDTSQIRVFARVKGTGVVYLFDRPVRYKSVEWGMGCSTCGPDSFNNSPRLDFFAENIGWFFAIVEPSATERSLIGFISQGDTLGKIPTGINRLEPSIVSFTLQQNYPNPFNPTTTISFSISSRSFVTLKIFDVMGRDVATMVSEEMSAGNYSRQWNATDFPSGVYFYRLKVGTFTETKRLILMRRNVFSAYHEIR